MSGRIYIGEMSTEAMTNLPNFSELRKEAHRPDRAAPSTPPYPAEDRPPSGEAAPDCCGPCCPSEAADARSAPRTATPQGERLDTIADNSTIAGAGRAGSPFQDRRRRRFELRETLWEVTTLDRLSACGRRRIDADKPIEIRSRTYEDGDGGERVGAYYANIQTCGSPWACPVCAAKIRQRRCEEIRDVVTGHLGAGGAAYMALFTLPHDQGDRLEALLEAVKAGWVDGIKSGAWQTDRRNAGIEGYVRSLEVTHGPSGWHPHYHVLLLTESVLSTAERRKLERRLHGRWADVMESEGYRRPRRGLCRVEPVRDSEAVGRYVGEAVTVPGEGRPRSVSLELTRHDLKEGRETETRTGRHRTPWEVLRDFSETGDCDDLSLWREYEGATQGERSIVFSQGLRSRYEVAEKTDEELAEEEQDGEAVAWIDRATWRKLTAVTGGLARLLSIAEGEGEDGVTAFLRSLRRSSRSP